MSALRRQLPVRSPFPLVAALAPLGSGDERPTVLRQLTDEYPGRTPFLTVSGTAALQAALEIAKATRGTAPVAMPAYACFDLATAALGAGVRVRLYDIDPLTLQPDLDSLARALGDDAAAVVVVHLYGIPVDLAKIRPLVSRSAALVIEDSAQGVGARVHGRPLGLEGDMCVLSFGRGKGLSGGGGGALLVSADLRAAATSHLAGVEMAQEHRGALFVKGIAQWMLARPAVYGIPSRLPFLRLGETIYHEPSAVRGMPASVARTLVHTWPLRAAETELRVAHARALRAELTAVAPDLVIPVSPGSEPGWLRLPLRLPERRSPDRATAAALGIVPSYPISLDALKPFATALMPTTERFPGARSLAASLWTLPTHGGLTATDIQKLAGWMRRELNGGLGS